MAAHSVASGATEADADAGPHDGGESTCVDLGAVADELYGISPSEFTAIRDQRANEARSEGDRRLSDAIKKLSKPTTSAWLANMLIRDRPDEVEELLSIGAALRDAQAELAGEELRHLSGRRRDAVASLVRAAQTAARERRQPVTETTVRELEQTLEAASIDSSAAAELRAGRLLRALQYSGLGFGDPPGAAPSQTARKEVSRGSGPPTRPRARSNDRAAAGPGSVELRPAVQDAKRAGRDADGARRREAEAERALEHVRTELVGAKAEVERLRTAVADAERDARDARHVRETAERAARDADQRVERLRRRY